MMRFLKLFLDARNLTGFKTENDNIILVDFIYIKLSIFSNSIFHT